MPLIFKNAPEPPYYAVTFYAEMTGIDVEQYRKMGDHLLNIAREQPGFLGYDDLCTGGNHSFNISYWESLKAIHN
ncbi:MAG: heme-degrading monooxygenase HmoA [Lysobacterales bacterium]|jgi:heme-degrading monooxygenase HmoA